MIIFLLAFIDRAAVAPSYGFCVPMRSYRLGVPHTSSTAEESFMFYLGGGIGQTAT